MDEESSIDPSSDFFSFFLHFACVFRHSGQDGHAQYGQYFEHAVLSDEQSRRCIGALAAAAEEALFEQRGEYTSATARSKVDMSLFSR